MTSALGNIINTMSPRQNGRHSADEILKWIFKKENIGILIQISPKFIPTCLIRYVLWFGW